MNGDMTKLLGLVVALVSTTAYAEKIFDPGSGGAWDCGSDAEVVINTTGTAYTLTGACSSVTVNGASNTVSIEKVDDITVNGVKQTVKIGAAEEITVNGTGNAVTYKAGISKAKAAVMVNGKNAVKQDAKLVIAVSGGAAPANASHADVPPPDGDGDGSSLDCAANKSPSITGAGGTYFVAGACDKVAITGSGNTVTIESTKAVAITGAKNTVVVTKTDKIGITGAGNSVTWGSGLTTKAPKVAKTGKGNTVAKVNAAISGGAASGGAASGGAVSGGAATGGGAIDCAKTASRSFNDNGGTFSFTGACDTIEINGNGVTVKAASIKNLNVSGNSNTVDVGSVEAASVSGNGNTVRYKSAKSKIANTGSKNTVTLVK